MSWMDDYEPVEDRLARFWDDHPDGRMLTDLVEATGQRVIFRAEAYRDGDDGRPWATGYAHEVPGEGNVNQASALENCETSAVGRALANAGYAPKGARPSREEMRKTRQNGSPSEPVADFDPVPEDVVAGLLKDATKVWEDKDDARGQVWRRLHAEANERGLPAPKSFRGVHPDLLEPVGKWVDSQQEPEAAEPEREPDDVPF